MRIDEVPPRVAILGGGYIAAEFAHVFSAFGAQTTVVLRGDKLTKHLDPDIARRVQRDPPSSTGTCGSGSTCRAAHGGRRGLHDPRRRQSSSRPTCCSSPPAGSATATGSTRRPPASRCTTTAGSKVDAHQRTSVPHIWALGDVSSDYQLKHVANHEARVVAHNLAHPDDLIESDHRFVPAAVFTHPAARLRRAHRGRGRRRRPALRHLAAALRRHRVRLGDGGHHEPVQADRRPRRPGSCSARTSWASRPPR